MGRWPPGWRGACGKPGRGYFRRCGLAFWLAACSDHRLRFLAAPAPDVWGAMPAPADWTFDEQRQRPLARTLCLKVA
ncbi:SctK family type III secretion system sorting platform protein [Pseudomonas aeruginosa]